MAYCTQTDIEKKINQNELIELTDPTGSGDIDTDAVDRAIADADAEINSYCGNYPIPFSPVPPMIRKLSVDMAIYNLFSLSSSVLDIPKSRQTQYDNAVRFLKDVAKGLISLGTDAADTPVEPASGSSEATRTKDDRIFSMEKKSNGSSGTLDNY